MLKQFKTSSGVHIEYEQQGLDYQQAITPILSRLDSERGALFASSFEYPGRYTCWDIGFINPPLVLTCSLNELTIDALNKRGDALLSIIKPQLIVLDEVQVITENEHVLKLAIPACEQIFAEEDRSRKPSVFTVLRQLLSLFKTDAEPYLGLYGAFGYDLIFQFEDITLCKERDANQRDMVLYLPDEIYIVNHRKEEAFVRRYDFQYHGISTHGLARDGAFIPYQPLQKPETACDHAPGVYANLVKTAQDRFKAGDLFEVVTSQTFYRHAEDNPSDIFMRMQQKNPSPYGFLINLGACEYLVGASPEMYVRVQGNRVETCPISGTIARGKDALEDAQNIQTLLSSDKECSELTMCTDVDRNDKSRICEPGSVKVIGRRQIEMYSRLIHTVDHVQGILRDGYDAIDAFLTHMWVVTVTGAPKLWAMNFIEQHEKSSRKWYGGAVGWLAFSGDVNTGLILRTMRIERGIAEIRVGATLLYDSNPEAEEQETHLKASAFLALLDPVKSPEVFCTAVPKNGLNKKVLLVDHQDSFVHTLANYIRQTGAIVTTIRSEHAEQFLSKQDYDLVVLSPGPGKPDDFNLAKTIRAALAKKCPVFGVCLGLQGIVEYFGGQLAVLDYPMHGKPSTIKVLEHKGLFNEFENTFTAGRYHSLYAIAAELPDTLTMTATTEDGIVMAVAHKTLPVHAVQFHPETILTMTNQAGLRIISNLMALV